mgnify:CR=1 FL=1
MTTNSTTSQNNTKTPVIIIGNEKGGCGKTTTAFHVIVSLLYEGYRVSSIDLDSRQRSLSHYLERRRQYIVENNIILPFPSHFIVNRSSIDSKYTAQQDERQRLVNCIIKASKESDFVVIDCPGNDTTLSRTAHNLADTVITPINDSFVDLDVLASIEEQNYEMSTPGIYSELIWDAKKNKAKETRGSIDWIVLRNRLSSLDAKNKRFMATALSKLSKRLGFRVANGFVERVIYRELFLKGLTLLDVMNKEVDVKVSTSHLAARQELRRFMDFLNLPSLIAPKPHEVYEEATARDVKSNISKA